MSLLDSPPQLSVIPNAYLTDGVHLLRTLPPPLAEGGERLLAVEDCKTLDVVLYTEQEITAMGLRFVGPVCEPQLDAAWQGTEPSEGPSLWERG
jgi:hypothetical protein